MSTTREYEALIILRPGGTEQEVGQHAARLEEPIKKLGGRIENVQPMGRRRLAFRIARTVRARLFSLPAPLRLPARPSI